MTTDWATPNSPLCTATKMTSKTLTQLDSSDEENPGDYLQDPELWTDNLPQPFRMLDNLLRDMLFRSWEMIESREMERERKAARVKIPEVSEWTRVNAVDKCGIGAVHAMECGKEGYVFIGGSHGLCVLRTQEDGGEMKLIAQSIVLETESVITKLDVVWNNGVHFVAAMCNKEIKIFVLVKDNLTCICSISPQAENPCAVVGQFSPTASHIGITVWKTESGVQLELHKLPLDSWHTQLNQYLDKLAATKSPANDGGESRANVAEEMVYSKPALLCVFHPPKGVSPCPTSDPAAAFERVKEGSRNHLPTGELHILTQKYFDNRRKAFLSERPHLADEYSITIDYSHSRPTLHFIYYKHSCKMCQPCYVTVWWEKHNHLFVYPLPSEPSKNPATTAIPLHCLLPQASAVITSAISSDSKLLAFGQSTGVVSVWNFQTDFCESTSVVAPEPDRITCLEFFGDNKIVGVGTERGNVIAIGTGVDRNKPPSPLRQSIKDEMELHGDVKSSGYDSNSRISGLRVNYMLPSVLSSVHDDGSVVLWSSSGREAVCKLCPPAFISPLQCLYTSDGRRMLAIVKGVSSENSVGSIMSVDITSAAIGHLLSKFWRKDRCVSESNEEEATTGGFMDVIERQLQEYINLRHNQHEADSIRWNKRWAELELHITDTQTLSN